MIEDSTSPSTTEHVSQLSEREVNAEMLSQYLESQNILPEKMWMGKERAHSDFLMFSHDNQTYYVKIQRADKKSFIDGFSIPAVQLELEQQTMRWLQENKLPVQEATHTWHDQDRYFIVSRAYEGGALGDRFRSLGGLDFDILLTMLERVGSTLEFMHEHGVYHRNINSGNIFFDIERNAYLADFGNVGLRETNDPALAAFEVESRTLGAPATKAPETFGQDEIRNDDKSDQYSLAVLLYQSITGGVRPYESLQRFIAQRGAVDKLEDFRNIRLAGHYYPLQYKLLDTELPTDEVSGTPESFTTSLAALDTVLQKALTTDPDARYETIGAFREAFDIAVRDLGEQNYHLFQKILHDKLTQT